MVREIMRDVEFLALQSEPTTEEDTGIADDLMDTLKANADRCVGMAANMIGIRKAVIVFDDNGTYNEMFDPIIIKKEGPFMAEEGCLSLTGKRTVRRYRSIRVQWLNRDRKLRVKKFTGWTAQIIQHEIDHIHGVII